MKKLIVGILQFLVCSYSISASFQTCSPEESIILAEFQMQLLKKESGTDSTWVKSYLNRGLNVNCVSQSAYSETPHPLQTTALLPSAVTCHPEITKALLASGAKIEFTTDTGKLVSLFPDLFFPWTHNHQRFECDKTSNLEIYNSIFKTVKNVHARSINKDWFNNREQLYDPDAAEIVIIKNKSYALDFLLKDAKLNPNDGNLPMLFMIAGYANTWQGQIPDLFQKAELVFNAGADIRQRVRNLDALAFAKIYSQGIPKYLAKAFPPCGLAGSIKERIENCESSNTTTSSHLRLVTRTQSFSELYYHETQKIFFGEKIETGWDFYWRRSNMIELMKASCDSYANSYPDFPQMSWRIPTQQDYQKFELDGTLHDISFNDYFNLGTSTIVKNRVWIKEKANLSFDETLYVACVSEAI